MAAYAMKRVGLIPMTLKMILIGGKMTLIPGQDDTDNPGRDTDATENRTRSVSRDTDRLRNQPERPLIPGPEGKKRVLDGD